MKRRIFCCRINTRSWSSGSESEHSSRIQIGFQISKIGPYKADSCIPNKAGELVGAIHMSLVCRALRKYTEGKALVYPLIGHGFADPQK